MTQKNIFTIITSTYSQGKFIEETIKSVISQAGEFYIEYIIQDSESKDNTIEIVQKYETIIQHGTAQKINGKNFWVNEDIRCLGISYEWESKKDTGTTNGINKGIAKSTGTIFQFLHSDDLLLPFALAEVNEWFRDPKVQAVYGEGLQIDEKSNPFGIYPTYDSNTNLEYSPSMNQPSVFVRLDIIKKIGGLNENIQNSFDYDLWFRLRDEKIYFHRSKAVLSATRYHKSTKTNQNANEIFLEIMALAKKYDINKSALKKWKCEFTHQHFFLSKFVGLFLKVQKLLYRKAVSLLIARIYTRIKFSQDKISDKYKSMFNDQSR